MKINDIKLINIIKLTILSNVILPIFFEKKKKSGYNIFAYFVEFKINFLY